MAQRQRRMPDRLAVMGCVTEVRESSGYFTFVYYMTRPRVLFDKAADDFGRGRPLNERYTVGSTVLSCVERRAPGADSRSAYKALGICILTEARLCEGRVAAVNKIGLVKLATGEEVIFTQASMGTGGQRLKNRSDRLDSKFPLGQRVFLRAIPNICKYYFSRATNERLYRLFAYDILDANEDRSRVIGSQRPASSSYNNAVNPSSSAPNGPHEGAMRTRSALSANSNRTAGDNRCVAATALDEKGLPTRAHHPINTVGSATAGEQRHAAAAQSDGPGPQPPAVRRVPPPPVHVASPFSRPRPDSMALLKRLVHGLLIDVADIVLSTDIVLSDEEIDALLALLD